MQHGGHGQVAKMVIMKEFKAIFFDMDGVLYDSMPNHEYTWCESFKAHGIEFRPEEAYINEGRTGRGTINLVIRRLYGRDATEEEVEKIYGYKTELMRQRPAAPKMNKMTELVALLRSRGVRVMVVTGSKQPTLIDKLHADYGFEREDIVSGADVRIGKPDPEPYEMALRRTGLKAEECAVVENAPMGVQSAKAAGLYTIAVNTGKLDDHYLTDERCDELYASTVDLYESFRR